MGQAIELAVSNIKKKYGAESIMKLTDKPVSTQSISTGCLGIDLALGVGGMPRGRIIEIFGPEGSGKSTLALHVVAQAQKAGLWAAYIDVEHALDPVYAEKLGVDFDKVYLSQPESGETALEIAEIMTRSGEVGVTIIDSVDALTPQAVIDGEMEDKHVGLLPRLMGQACRKLKGVVAQSKSCMIFINQLRSMINIGQHGPAETTSGGRALRYYASMRIDIRRIASIKDSDDQQIGNRSRLKAVKNRLACPYKEIEFDIIFGKGINQEGDLLDLAVASKIVDRAGAWFSYKGTRLGQGRDMSSRFLGANPEIAAEIKTEILIAKGVLSKEEDDDED